MTQAVANTGRRDFLRSMMYTGAAAALTGPTAAFAATPRARKIHGLFPIAFTPVDSSNKIDMDGLAGQVKFCQRGKVHGIAWPQIASGWTQLTEKERMAGAEVMLNAGKGGKTAIAIGVQSPDYEAVKRYTAHAHQYGADAIVCIPPTNLTTDAQYLDYYKRVGDLTDKPLMIQAVGEMSVDLLVRIYESVPTARFVKDESGEPIDRVQEIVRRTNGQLGSFSGRGVSTMITEMERGFTGHCPFVSISDIYAQAYDLWHAGRKRQAYEYFGAIQAANTLFSQSSPDVLIARGVFKPGTKTRTAPAAAGSNARKMPAGSPEEIKRILDTYLKPYLRA